MSVSGLRFLKVTQPGVLTPASHPSVWFRHMHPQSEKLTFLFFPHSLQGRRDPPSALSPVFPFSGTRASATLVPPWTLGRTVLSVRSSPHCVLLELQAGAVSWPHLLFSAKFRPGLPPFQRMTLPYDPHSGNSNLQASLSHFYILQSCGSHSCRIQA